MLAIFLAGLIISPIIFKQHFPITTTDFFAFLLVWASVTYQSELIISNKAINWTSMWVADRSYSIYLCHMPALMISLWLSEELKIPIAPDRLIDIRWLITLTIILSFSEFSYRFCEMPLRLWGRSYVKKYF